MADFSDINAIPPLRPELLEKVRDPAAKAVLQEIVDAWKRLMRLGQITRVAGEYLSSNVPNHDHDATTAGHGGILTNDRHDGYSQYDISSAPAAGTDAARIYAADISAGNTALFVQGEGTYAIKLLGFITVPGAGTDCEGFGAGALAALAAGGTNNTAVGKNALNAITTADNSTAIGKDALLLATAGENVAIGARAGDAITTGVQHVALGTDALGAMQTNHNCVAIGYNALLLATGGENVGIGANAGDAITTGVQNVAIGTASLGAMQTGNNCVALGYSALLVATGTENVGIGAFAGDGITTGVQNVAIGTAALRVGGTNSIGIGYQALVAATGNSNTAVGASAGTTVTSGTDNILLGYNAQTGSATATFRTVIGSGAVGTANNQIMLGTASEHVVAPGHVYIGGGATASELRFLEPSGGGASYVGFKSPALAGNIIFDLPNAFPATSGFALTCTTGGTMSWDAAAIVLAAGSAATVTLGGGANPAILRHLEGSGGGTNYIGFKAAATMGASLDYTLPDAAPAANGYVLSSTTAGVMSWASAPAMQSISLVNNFTNATNTLNNTNLSFTVGATKTYRLTGRIKCGNSTITEGIQFDFGGGSCSATTFEAEIMATNGTLVLGGTTTSSLTTALSLSSSTNPDELFINGFLLTNGGGTLILRFAENSAHVAGTASLIAGTWLELVETTPL